jgi:hypothetical protein
MLYHDKESCGINVFVRHFTQSIQKLTERRRLNVQPQRQVATSCSPPESVPERVSLAGYRMDQSSFDIHQLQTGWILHASDTP